MCAKGGSRREAGGWNRFHSEIVFNDDDDATITIATAAAGFQGVKKT